jgi:enamine deaminase RidA (YjgF/YER057c/UK114 family)
MSSGGIRAFTFTPDDGVPPAVAPFAHATAAGPKLYVTGQMPTDVTGTVVGDDVATQTDQVVRNLVRVTELCGGGLADVVAVRAYLVDWADYQAFNDAYARCFPIACPAAPAWAPPASPSAPSSRSTGCVGEATAGVTDIQLQGGTFRRRRGVAASSAVAVARSMSTTSDSSALLQDS